MDDPRIEWVRDRVNLALHIQDPEVFEDLLNRDDGEPERDIAKFLNETPEDDKSALLFYKIIQEEEEEVEVECGEYHEYEEFYMNVRYNSGVLTTKS